MEIQKPLALIGLGLVGLFGLYLAGRVLFRAWFKSKMEYHKELRRETDERTDPE